MQRLAAAAAVVLFQGCASLGSGEHCAPIPEERASEAPSGRLSVLSWNVHGLPFDDSVRRRMDAIAREIRARQPDLVLLQEVGSSRVDLQACKLEYSIVSPK